MRDFFVGLAQVVGALWLVVLTAAGALLLGSLLIDAVRGRRRLWQLRRERARQADRDRVAALVALNPDKPWLRLKAATTHGPTPMSKRPLAPIGGHVRPISDDELARIFAAPGVAGAEP